MSEKNNQANVDRSAITRIKQRSMLKKQRLAIIFVSAAILILIVALFAVNYLIDIYVFPDEDGTRYYIRKINGKFELCYTNGEVLDKSDDGYYLTDMGTEVKIDPSTGKHTVMLKVDIDGTEELDYGQNILIFKQLTYDASKTNDQTKIIKSIEVHNEYGSYSFERKTGNTFAIKGYEGTPFNQESFAQLAVSCGYTISTVRLESPLRNDDGSIDYSEYGLAPEKRTKTETDENGNEIEVEYDYEPSWYVITTMSGDTHKVYIGDLTVTGTGYYAKYEDRDKIYVLSSNGFSELVLQKVEKFITPMIVTPTDQNYYFDVHDFIIYDNIDHDGIIADLEEKFGDGEKEEISEEEFNEIYYQLLEKNSHKTCHLSFQDMASRKGTLYSYIPFVSKLEYADGYRINSDSVYDVLYELYATEFTEVVKLNPEEDDLKEYGLYESPYMILFYYKSENEKGETVYIENQISISAKTDDGIFYAYSPIYDMIVGVNESSFGFLEWDELMWYENNYIQLDIAHVEEITIESPDVSVSFRIDDSVSRYMSYLPQSGSGFKDGDKTYNIVKNNGKYTLSSNNTALPPIYSGDFLVTPLQYTKGVDSGQGYLFYESKQVDANGDGNNDSIIFYIYNIYGTAGNYRLAAIKRVTTLAGETIGEDELIWFDPQKNTDFFITASNYIYIADQGSYIGQKLDEKYMQEGNIRGRWGSGSLYSTADGQTLVVNSKTGEWSILSGMTCGIFFADGENSRLASRALHIPEIVENGKIKLNAETYYPTTANDLYFDDETGDILVIDKKTKERKAATYEDCTIGIWCSGFYFATEGGNLVAVNEATGDWGTVYLVSNESYVADVYADGKRLDYVIKTTNHVGRLVNTTAMDNFKQFYGGILYASFEGMAEIGEEQKSEFRLHDDFSTGDNGCQLKITVKAVDAYGNRRDITCRIYQYSERKSYITIEALSPEDGFASDSTNGYGNFYVLRSFADKIIEDAKRMINAEEIDSATKY